VAPRLIVLGDCNPDLMLMGGARPTFGQVETLVDEASLTIGGSGAITACGAARLGLDCALIAAVGDDVLGQAQLSGLAAAGVDTSAIVTRAELATGVSVILGDADDRAVLTAPGAIDSLAAADVDPALLARADHVHVSSYFLLSRLRPGLPHLLRGARNAGATTSVDTNWDPYGAWRDALEPILDAVDLLLPNLAEAQRLSGLQDPEAAATALADRVPTVAVKLGAEGAIAVSGEGSVWARPPAVEVVDTTGAGDSFNAGFIAARLGGASLAEAVELAVACGALSARGLGGTAAQPNLEQAQSAGANAR
jgi:sugar/nucleoside kinase (ribokinase family)